MGLISGDLKAAIGEKSFKIKGITFDLKGTKLSEMVSFSNIVTDCLGDKTKDTIKVSDGKLLETAYRDWVVKFIMDKDPGIDKEVVGEFVFKNLDELIKEFTIVFGIKSREKYEEDAANAKENLEKND